MADNTDAQSEDELTLEEAAIDAIIERYFSVTGLPQNVEYWHEDEQTYYRDGGWDNDKNPEQVIWNMRKTKAIAEIKALLS